LLCANKVVKKFGADNISASCDNVEHIRLARNFVQFLKYGVLSATVKKLHTRFGLPPELKTLDDSKRTISYYMYRL